mgnify:CR=1 FL=1
MNNNIRALIFDLGNVIININMRDFYKKILPVSDNKEIDIYKDLWEPIEKLDKGLFSKDDFYQESKKRFQFQDVSKEKFFHMFNSIFNSLNYKLLDFIKRLKQDKKFKVFALSNTNPLHVEFLANNIINFREHFDQVFYSYELGMIKPDPKIFLYLLEHINYEPSECIFIDDNRKNVKVAEQIGMIGIQFRNETKFLEEINDLLSIS